MQFSSLFGRPLLGGLVRGEKGQVLETSKPVENSVAEGDIIAWLVTHVFAILLHLVLPLADASLFVGPWKRKALLLLSSSSTSSSTLPLPSHTWNGVVQDKAKESSYEHVCGEEHDNHLVQLFYSFKQKWWWIYVAHMLLLLSHRSKRSSLNSSFLK